MIRYRLRTRALAIAMCAIAGYVDAIGFLGSDRLFVSFMSGNSTRLAVGLVEGTEFAALAAGAIALFVAGVVVGTLVARRFAARRMSVVLAAVASLLAIAGACAAAGADRVAIGWMVVAMGMENTAFERDGEVSIGVTYVTGTLVKAGQHLASAIAGHERWTWLWYVVLWIGLVAGAAIGTLAHARWGLGGVFAAAGAAAGLATLSAVAIDRHP